MNKKMKKPSQDKTVRRMLYACLFGFGGFVTWGALAPLEEGVAANGQSVGESDRQVIQPSPHQSNGCGPCKPEPLP